MNTMNDEPYDLHDQDEDDDDLTGSLHDDDDDDEYDQDEGEDHAIDSDIALDGFTDRAMRHGRRAATWLLIGAVGEAALLIGASRVMTRLRSAWLALPSALIAGGVITMVACLIYVRWNRHRTKMANVLEDAMVWRSDVQGKEQDEANAVAQHYRDRADEDKREALAEELTWNVGPAPVFIDADGCRHPTAEQVAFEECQRREFGDLFDTLDRRSDEHDGDVESDNEPAVPDSPALRAWMQRWADVKPVQKSRPARLVKRHSDAEGRRLERELCRAINKHSDGAFHKLLDEGADPNGHDGSGKPLVIAVLRGRLEYVSWLLTLGADPNAQCYGRTILATLMRQVEQYADESDGDGDDHEWPERIELLARWGANPHIENKWYDEDDDDEGPKAWPFIAKRPTLYEAFMKGRNAWLQADDDSLRLLREARESVALAEVADATRAMLDTFRSPGRA